MPRRAYLSPRSVGERTCPPTPRLSLRRTGSGVGEETRSRGGAWAGRGGRGGGASIRQRLERRQDGRL